MKYIIELEEIPNTNLYKAKGANTLVFDEKGIKNILTPYEEPAENVEEVEEWEEVRFDDLKEGDIVRETTLMKIYEFKGLSKNKDCVNLINIDTGCYTNFNIYPWGFERKIDKSRDKITELRGYVNELKKYCNNILCDCSSGCKLKNMPEFKIYSCRCTGWRMTNEELLENEELIREKYEAIKGDD